MVGKRLTPHGLTIKQETFAQELITCGNASAAYRLAYNASRMGMATVNREAARLTDNPKIATRIEELRKEHRNEHDITISSVAEEFNELMAKAVKLGQLGPAVSALKEKARLFGLYGEDNSQQVSSITINRNIIDPKEDGKPDT